MLSSVSTRSHCQPESAERIMEDPDNSAQKPVATAGSRKSGVLKLPLANRCGLDKQHYPNDESNKNPAKSRSRRQSLWYALYFPQLSGLSESQQTQILTELAGGKRQCHRKLPLSGTGLRNSQQPQIFWRYRQYPQQASEPDCARTAKQISGRQLSLRSQPNSQRQFIAGAFRT